IGIYSGTRPATPDTALSGNTLLATLTFSATAFGTPTSAVPSVATANAITQCSSAVATGTASFFRCFKSDGTTAVFDGNVGTSGSDMNINSTSIVAGGIVQCTSLTVQL
ncbi:MAG TPA: hypothetical protein VN436_02265, partial [Holophaga sp.]|nr:hypothetical protein [Holophaga sp.]